MYSDCRGRLQHKGSFGFVQNAEKIVQVACFFFLTETSNAENKATVYLIFTDMPGHHLISSRYLRLKYGQTPPTLLSLLSILKDFPVRQYVQAACDTEGTSIILILCVCSFLEHSSDPSMKSTCAEPHMSLVLMTDVISEGSGEHCVFAQSAH